MADIGKILSVQGISNTRVISDFHSKSPDLVIIIIDLLALVKNLGPTVRGGHSSIFHE